MKEKIPKKPTSAELSLVKTIVASYENNQQLVQVMLDQLCLAIVGSRGLMSHVHSLRWRVKDPSHLKDKLLRKLKKAKEGTKKFDVTKSNLYEKINDLAGLRILHLHASQIVDIDRELKDLFREYHYEIVEGPTARTWDDEYRKFYTEVGVKTVDSPKMYTSVHYVVAPNSETKITCEIQVRTLAEELWGEVDHSMNYPHECKVDSCREQIKVLARVTSSCSRLVDSIYRTSSASAQAKVRAKKRIQKKQ
jgi:ppGpp synthetase/RelA/SpoT-type nucleotidyltranferase